MDYTDFSFHNPDDIPRHNRTYQFFYLGYNVLPNIELVEKAYVIIDFLFHLHY